MSLVNQVLIIIGAIVALIGILSFINPNFTRIINFPGGPKLKAIGALIIGLILMIIGFIVNIPME